MKIYSIEEQNIYDFLEIKENILTIFISECNLNCNNCNINWIGEGRKISINFLLEEIGKKFLEKKYPDFVLITGGEPLIYFETTILCNALISLGKEVILKTNGSAPLENIPRDVIKIVSFKLPSSREEDSFFMENLLYLTRNDFIRFNVYNDKDLNFAIDFLLKIDFSIAKFKVIFFIFNNLLSNEMIKKIINNKFLKNSFEIPCYKIIFK